MDCVRHLGCTALTIPHDMASAMRIGDQAAMLFEGKIVWDGAASALLTSGDALLDRFTHGRHNGPIDPQEQHLSGRAYFPSLPVAASPI